VHCKFQENIVISSFAPKETAMAMEAKSFQSQGQVCSVRNGKGQKKKWF
jgi:hypothetical protein